VADGVIVRRRHPREHHPVNEARGIVPGPERIAIENAELLQVAGLRRRTHGIAIPIDGRIVLSRVLVVRSRKKSEDALARLGCQDGTHERFAKNVALFIDEKEEERLVADDWAAQTDSKLVSVF